MLKKLIAGFLGAAVMTCGMTMITAGAVDTASTAVRTVIVKTQGDDTGGYLEVGLQVDGGTKMSSVAATLTYDASKLAPYAWEGDAAVDLSGKTGWTAAAAIPTKAPDNISGKASVAYAEGTAGHLMLSAEAIQPVTLTQTAPGATMTEPVAQVVTMRMKYTGAFAAAAASIGYDTAATGSPAGGTVVLSDGAASTTYTGGLSATVTSGKTVAGTSGAAGDDIVPLVLYDWDGTTVLGTVLASKTMTADEVKAAVQAFVTANTDSFTKAGYTFENRWVKLESGAPGRYGRVANAATAVVSENNDLDPSAEFQWSAVRQGGSYTLKAAYNGSAASGMPSATSALKNRYTTSVVGYSRFGTSTNYAIRVQVDRKNTTAEPVTQIGELALRVTMTDDSGNTSYNLINMENKDGAVAEIAVTQKIATVKWAVVDTYNNSNWVGTTARSVDFSEKRGTTAEKNGFAYQGTLGYINEQLSPAGTLNVTLGMLTTDLGLTYGGTIEDAKTKLQTAWRAKNPNYETATSDTYIALSADEMQAALNG